MIGKILDYSISDSGGVISAEDGNRYEFINAEWKSDKAPNIGQSVDFVVKDNKAIGVYLVSSNTFNSEETLDMAKEKFDEIKKSELFSNLMRKKDEVLRNGMKYKYGFILTILLLIFYFLPVVETYYIGAYSLSDGDLGSYVIFGLLVLAVFFYVGVKAILIRIVTAIVVFMIVWQYYDLLSSISNIGNLMSMDRRYNNELLGLLKFGNLFIIPFTILLSFAGLFKRDRI